MRSSRAPASSGRPANTRPAARGVLLTELLLIGRPPITGDVAYAAGCAAVALYTPVAAREPFEAPPPPTQSAGEKKEIFNFTHVALGFGFGFVVASLCALQ